MAAACQNGHNRGMRTDTTLPIHVSAEAAEHIAALGLQEPFAQMLQRAREQFAGLHLIEVTLDYAPWDSPEPGIVFRMHYPGPPDDLDLEHRGWNAWLVEAFPPDVLRHFAMISYYEPPYGR